MSGDLRPDVRTRLVREGRHNDDAILMRRHSRPYPLATNATSGSAKYVKSAFKRLPCSRTSEQRKLNPLNLSADDSPLYLTPQTGCQRIRSPVGVINYGTITFAV